MTANESIREEHIEVTRTARYALLGPSDRAAQEVWFVLHGYGQLATRFLRGFGVLDDGTRLLVAPEGLSRFYVDADHVRGARTTRVGASWMTREDRVVEIADYLRYLDAVARRALAGRSSDAPTITVLGFSQGVATATRWVAQGALEADRLILWAGGVPPDLDLDVVGETLRRCQLTLVLGSQDELIPPGALAEEEERLRRHKIPFTTRRFEGGHHLDSELLQALAVGA